MLICFSSFEFSVEYKKMFRIDDGVKKRAALCACRNRRVLVLYVTAQYVTVQYVTVQCNIFQIRLKKKQE